MDTVWANAPGSKGNAPQGSTEAVALSSAGQLGWSQQQRNRVAHEDCKWLGPQPHPSYGHILPMDEMSWDGTWTTTCSSRWEVIHKD